MRFIPLLLLLLAPTLVAAQAVEYPPKSDGAREVVDKTIAIPDSQNVHLRNGLDNSRIKFSETGKGSVAFIGGSITEMNGYRPMVSEFLTQRFPETEFKFTDAGVSSTCSTTGAFRLAHDVLADDPDLLFIEFAVNDDQDAGHAARECRRGMEGIVRQALKHNPQMDIVITYFVNPPMLELLRNGQTPVSCQQHEAVAVQYGVSTVDLAREVAARIDGGQLTWATYGGTHPKPAGNRIAADLIVDLLSAAWSEPLDPSAQLQDHRLPKPLDPRCYDRGRWVSVRKAEGDANWNVGVPDWSQIPGQMRSRFTATEVMSATIPGAELSLRFSGTAVGGYVLAGPDAGTIEVSVDGGEYLPIDLYHRFSAGLHYPRTVMFATDLDDRDHQLTLRISGQHDPQSQGHAVRILQFAAN